MRRSTWWKSGIASEKPAGSPSTKAKNTRSGSNHHLQVRGAVFDLLVAPRHEPPVPGPGVVVDQLEQLHLAVELAQVRAANGDVVAPPHQLRQPRRPRRHRRLARVHVQRHQILGLGQPRGLQQARIVGGIVGHQDGGREIVGIQQGAHRLGRGRVHRPPQVGHAACLQPLSSGVQQRARHHHQVLGLEEAEEAGTLIVEAVVLMVDDGGDGAHDRAVVVRQERLDRGMPVERVCVSVSSFFLKSEISGGTQAELPRYTDHGKPHEAPLVSRSEHRRNSYRTGSYGRGLGHNGSL